MMSPGKFNRTQEATAVPLQPTLARKKQHAVRTTGRQTMTGGVTGAALGVLCGIALLSGAVPNLEILQSFGTVLPAVLGLCMAGVGTIFGSFIDLNPHANKWRKR